MKSKFTSIKRFLHLPYLQFKNIKIIYFTYFATSAWFMMGMWYIYFLKVISPEQIALMHTIGFIAGILVDIPSGFLADRFGRKLLLSFGLVTFGIGIGLFIFISNIWQMIIFEVITQIGLACISGAQEAVLYDTVNAITEDKSKVSEVFAEIYSRCRMIVNISLLTSGLIGGIIYRFSDIAGWLLMSAFCLTAFLLVLTLDNHQQKGTSIEIQILSHTKESIKVFMQKKNAYLIPAILILGGLAFASDWGIFPMGSMEQAGFTPLGISIFFVVIYIIAIISNHYLPRITNKFGNYNGFKYYSLAATLLLLIGIGAYKLNSYLIVLPLSAFIIISILLISYSTIVVTRISNEVNRATMLSISSFSTKFLYMVSGPFIGYSFAHNAPEYSWLGYAALAIIAFIVINFLVKKHLIDNSNTKI